MVIGIFGESCTGKSTLASALSQARSARVFSGKDYMKLAKSEPEAKRVFVDLLESFMDNSALAIYVIAEREQLAMLPKQAIRVLATADINEIKARFAGRLGSELPAPIAKMLEKKHGMFDSDAFDLKLKSGELPLDDVCDAILGLCPV